MKNRLYHSNVATTANMFKMDRDRMFLEEGNKRDAIWNIARIIASTTHAINMAFLLYHCMPMPILLMAKKIWGRNAGGDSCYDDEYPFISIFG